MGGVQRGYLRLGWLQLGRRPASRQEGVHEAVTAYDSVLMSDADCGAEIHVTRDAVKPDVLESATTTLVTRKLPAALTSPLASARLDLAALTMTDFSMTLFPELVERRLGSNLLSRLLRFGTRPRRSSANAVLYVMFHSIA
jgi:hypothetical protein